MGYLLFLWAVKWPIPVKGIFDYHFLMLSKCTIFIVVGFYSGMILRAIPATLALAIVAKKPHHNRNSASTVRLEASMDLQGTVVAGQPTKCPVLVIHKAPALAAVHDLEGMCNAYTCVCIQLKTCHLLCTLEQ